MRQTMTTLPTSYFSQYPVLRQKAKKVSILDGSIQRLIDDMIETMQRANGHDLSVSLQLTNPVVNMLKPIEL
jgi:peptide deformylase